MSRQHPPAATVLVVDDTPDRLELLSLIVRQSGHSVLEARDGREGYDAAKAARPDLIISDVSMPRVDGVEFCKLVRSDAELRSTPILLVSALRRDSHSAVEGIKAGDDDYIEAPYDPSRLRAKVERLIERRRVEEEIRRLNATLEQKVAERTSQLAEANVELEAFNYMVSHDLREPLKLVRGFAEKLKRRAAPTLDETGLGYLEVISGTLDQAGKMIDDLLAFSRLGRGDLKRAPVDMGRLVEEVREALEAGGAEGRAIEWETGRLPEVRGDACLLRLVWRNLLSNAVKYTRKNPAPRIRVGSVEGAEETIFFVGDNGVGFDARDAGRLFGVFSRLHSPAEFEGTGVGLASVRRVVARHGGRTWAEGEAGRGATFYFSLPRHPAPPPERSGLEADAV